SYRTRQNLRLPRIRCTSTEIPGRAHGERSFAARPVCYGEYGPCAAVSRQTCSRSVLPSTKGRNQFQRIETADAKIRDRGASWGGADVLLSLRVRELGRLGVWKAQYGRLAIPRGRPQTAGRRGASLTLVAGPSSERVSIDLTLVSPRSRWSRGR